VINEESSESQKVSESHSDEANGGRTVERNSIATDQSEFRILITRVQSGAAGQERERWLSKDSLHNQAAGRGAVGASADGGGVSLRLACGVQ